MPKRMTEAQALKRLFELARKERSNPKLVGPAEFTLRKFAVQLRKLANQILATRDPIKKREKYEQLVDLVKSKNDEGQ